MDFSGIKRPTSPEAVCQIVGSITDPNIGHSLGEDFLWATAKCAFVPLMWTVAVGLAPIMDVL